LERGRTRGQSQPDCSGNEQKKKPDFGPGRITHAIADDRALEDKGASAGGKERRKGRYEKKQKEGVPTKGGSLRRLVVCRSRHSADSERKGSEKNEGWRVQVTRGARCLKKPFLEGRGRERDKRTVGAERENKGQGSYIQSREKNGRWDSKKEGGEAEERKEDRRKCERNKTNYRSLNCSDELGRGDLERGRKRKYHLKKLDSRRKVDNFASLNHDWRRSLF